MVHLSQMWCLGSAATLAGSQETGVGTDLLLFTTLLVTPGLLVINVAYSVSRLALGCLVISLMAETVKEDGEVNWSFVPDTNAPSVCIGVNVIVPPMDRGPGPTVP